VQFSKYNLLTDAHYYLFLKEVWHTRGTHGCWFINWLPNGSPNGVVVISANPGGLEENVGILLGDVILAIDNKSTENMDIYDTVELLQ
jgi:S1-C subfamily serine protease